MTNIPVASWGQRAPVRKRHRWIPACPPVSSSLSPVRMSALFSCHKLSSIFRLWSQVTRVGKNPKNLSPSRSANNTWSLAEKVLSSRVDRVGEAFRRPLADADFMAGTEMSWKLELCTQGPKSSNVKVLFLCRAQPAQDRRIRRSRLDLSSDQKYNSNTISTFMIIL